MMRPSVLPSDHDRRGFMEIPLADLRELDAATVCSLWARRLLETGDLSPREKQNLRDICRQHRQAATNRSSFATLLDLSPRAGSPADALFGLTLTRVSVLGRSEYRLPCRIEARTEEQTINGVGDLAQLEHEERRSRTTLEGVVHAMTAQ